LQKLELGLERVATPFSRPASFARLVVGAMLYRERLGAVVRLHNAPFR
jgi:hypothetical protein